jgi:hypothetical protein
MEKDPLKINVMLSFEEKKRLTDFFLVLIEKNNLEKELIGITTSYKNLAKGILVIVKDEAATRLGMVYPVPADEAQALDLLKSDKTFEINIKK